VEDSGSSIRTRRTLDRIFFGHKRPEFAAEAIVEAFQMATYYLDAEEQKLHAKNRSPQQVTPYRVTTSQPAKPAPS
jgi:hypothetical protein